MKLTKDVVVDVYSQNTSMVKLCLLVYVCSFSSIKLLDNVVNVFLYACYKHLHRQKHTLSEKQLLIIASK